MVQVPIVSGIYTDSTADFRTSYPINMRPIPKVQGISTGYLQVNEGVTANGTGPGVTRGGIEWDQVPYRVMGERLVRIERDGSATDLGAIPGTGTASMTYSFERLAIVSGGRFFQWVRSTNTLVEVTDPDLGTVKDVTWVDGYFVLNDNENIIVTELTDPTQINPLRYGSSEVDPDPVQGVLRLRNELYTVNRHSIENFQNIGGTGFPFQVIRGAQVHKGAVGTHAAVVYGDAIAFLGGGRNESPAVWLGVNGGATKISTREIDELLFEYTEFELSQAFIEVQTEKSHSIMMIHLPDQTLCYDGPASQQLGAPTWFILKDENTEQGGYSARHFVWAYDRWLVGNPRSNEIGYIDKDTADLWGREVSWQFGTPIVYNESRGAIFHELELVAIGGAVRVTQQEPSRPNVITDKRMSVPPFAAPADTSAPVEPRVTATIYTEYSLDGASWSDRRYVSAGANGARDTRYRWFRNGRMSAWRVQRFGGTSRSPISVARLEARFENLAW